MFGSWMNDRAIVYRRKYNIPVRMGHRRQRAGDGLRQYRRQIRFRRGVHAQSGERREESFYGEFLINAQGEDVVAGVRTPEPVAQLQELHAEGCSRIGEDPPNLEKHFKDVQDFEFTIQDGKVFMLQTRNGKRTGAAAVRFAIDMEKEKLIDWKTAIKRVPADQLDQVLAPVFDRQAVARRQESSPRDCPPVPARHPAIFISTPIALRRLQKKGEKVLLVRNRDLARRFARHDRGRRHSHGEGRRQFARGARRSADGQGLRLRRERRSRSITQQNRDSRRPDVKEGDFLSIDGTAGTVYAGPDSRPPPPKSSRC